MVTTAAFNLIELEDAIIQELEAAVPQAHIENSYSWAQLLRGEEEFDPPMLFVYHDDGTPQPLADHGSTALVSFLETSWKIVVVAESFRGPADSRREEDTGAYALMQDVAGGLANNRLSSLTGFMPGELGPWRRLEVDPPTMTVYEMSVSWKQSYITQ